MPRDILDKSVDHDAARPTQRRDTDRDSRGFPLVHVIQGTLPTHVHEINPLAHLTNPSVWSDRYLAILLSLLRSFRLRGTPEGP